MSAYTTVYHERGILVVSKESGTPSQPSQSKSSNLFDLLGSEHGYVGMHHRLDQPASGLMLFTTSSAHNKYISESFKKHRIQRKYTLVVAGKLSTPCGSWTEDIKDQRAETMWFKKGYCRRLSLLEAEIKTGRTHQIRIHAQRNGTPIVGDRRYGGFAGQLWPRLALHAHELCFVHPVLNERVTVQAPVPADLKELMLQFGATLPSTQVP